MKRFRQTAGLLGLVFGMGFVLSACAPKQNLSEPDLPKQSETQKVTDDPATLGQVADYLLTAADDYNGAVARGALLEGMEDEEEMASRLQALVMVSRAFGPLPAPSGNNERLAAKNVNLGGVPEWARKDLENLQNGGILAPSDLGQEEAGQEKAAQEDAVQEDAAQGNTAQEEAGQEKAAQEDAAQGNTAQEEAGQEEAARKDAAQKKTAQEYALQEAAQEYALQKPPAGGSADGWDAPVSLKEVETYCKRVFALFGTNLKDDFYANVNQEALEHGEIPAGQTSAGGSSTVTLETNEKVYSLIREIVNSDENYAPGSSEQKIRDFYRSILAPRPGNTEPLKPWFDQIDAAGTLSELREVQMEIVRRMGLTVNGLLMFSLSNDLSDPTKKVLNLASGFMYMSLEDYENPDSEAHKARRASLMERLEKVGETGQTAEELVDAIIALEYEQIKNGMTGEEASDLKNFSNTLTMDELDAMMPELGAKEFLTGLGFDASIRVQVYDIKGFRITAEHMRESELPRLKAQVKMNLLDSSEALLTGQASEEEALALVANYLSTEVGQLYVADYFPPEAKAAVEDMVDKLIQTFEKRISSLDWMSEETKTEALKKLETLKVMIGYPEPWPESKVVIKAPEDGGSYFENNSAIGRERLRQAVESQDSDGKEFTLQAFMVNAAANRQSNTLTFPAGILQPPFYDPDASMEENLGGIGVIIAHELTHTFDDMGAQYDSSGAVRDWWTQEDYAHFRQLCEKAVEFYDGAEAAPGISVSGKMTLSENIADIGGVACALDVLSTMENPDYDAFFRSYANSWLLLTDRENTEMLAGSDEHAPKKLRVNEVLKNFRQFYDTYDIGPGDGMYTAPEDRIKIW